MLCPNIFEHWLHSCFAGPIGEGAVVTHLNQNNPQDEECEEGLFQVCGAGLLAPNILNSKARKREAGAFVWYNSWIFHVPNSEK